MVKVSIAEVNDEFAIYVDGHLIGVWDWGYMEDIGEVLSKIFSAPEFKNEAYFEYAVDVQREFPKELP